MTALSGDAVAIVGLAGRFPGAADVEHFWANTLSGATSVTRRVDDATGALLWARGELGDIALFDPNFFGMSPRDALLLDPQHRILLECAWEALADATAGGGRDGLCRTAVFAGANYSGYRELLQQSGAQVSAVEFDGGVDKDFLATTIAYRLGLQGPCMTVQTACSSSLVAVHLASQALLEFDADQALVGGVSITLPHTPGWRFEPRGIHSADGVCRPFDAAANGTVMGDGAAMVVLRRLEDAIADGCHIYAVITGSAVNNDGSRKIGYAAPSLLGQAEVIHAAQARAGVDPAEIGYVETHGTGTPLGDQVEFHALLKAFGAEGSTSGRCALGSAKGAIGHLDVAAGVTGLVRATLALHHATLPGTVNHDQAHPDLVMESSPFYVPRTPAQWRQDGRRRAAVSSFGIGGTNAHVILEEYPSAVGYRTQERPTLLSEGYEPRRYWPAPSAQASTPGIQDIAAGTRVEYRRATWREWTPGRRLPDRPEYSQVILLADEGAAGDHLHRLLRSHRPDVIRADTTEPHGGGFPDLGDEVLRRTATPGRSLLVCAWAWAAPTQVHRCYDALTALATRWLRGDRPAGGLDVVLLTQGAYAVTDDSPGDPALAALTGLARVLSMEAPALRIRVLDVTSAGDPAFEDTAETVLTWYDEPVLVRRGRRWWHHVFDDTRAPASVPVSDVQDQRVTVLIGIGQVGSAAARVLAAAGGTLVLCARPGTGTTRAETLRCELESETATILVECCDAADPAQISSLLTRLAERYGALDQVILAAGKSGDGAYQSSADLPRWHDEEHFKIKVDGVAALAKATDEHDIGRVVLMSSLAGVLGAISLGPYAAAAAVMDSFADRYNGRRTAWLSIGWDAWQHSATATSVHESRMVQDGLTAAEAQVALSHLLLSDATGHILVVKGDIAGRWDRFVRQPLHQAAPTEPTTAIPAAPTASDVPRIVLHAWRACLETPNLNLDDDLLQHGADSLNAIEVLVILGERFKLTLPTNLIFETQTPRLLATHIGGLLADANMSADGSTHPSEDLPTVRQWGNSGPLIWCLHPISGSADSFRDLADQLTAHQLRAVSGQPLADVDHEESISCQAARYYEALTTAGDPPSALIGWSYGGILAFELAQHVLSTTGHAPPVILLDIPAPTGAEIRSIDHVSDAEILMAIMSHRLREGGQVATVDFAQLLLDEEEHAMKSMLSQLRVAGALPTAFTADIARELTSGYRRRMKAAEQYRPVPYPGRVTLLRANEAEFGDTGVLAGVLTAPADDPGWGWPALAEGGFTVEVLDGHHSTLLQLPTVATVAQRVRDSLRATTEVRP